MITNNHIIKAQEYQIAFDDKSEAYRMQSSISALQTSRVNALLESILNRYSKNEVIYQFSKIELDLGVINKSNYENELVYKLEEALINFFKTNILENGTVKNGKKINSFKSKIEHFEVFILKGYTQWNTSLQTPSQLFKDLINEDRSKVRAVLVKHGKNATVRKRIIFQFSEKLLENIVTLFAGNDDDNIIAYKNNILEHQEKHQLVKVNSKGFRNAIWEIIFAYLFAESQSYYNRKVFLKYLIQKIALRYNLTYNSLLKLMAQGVQLQSEISYSFGFKKIILELENQELNGDTNETIAPVKTPSVADTIREMDQFLKTGSYLPEFGLISKNEFNKQLHYLLKSKNEAVQTYIKNWISSSSKKDRLLAFADDSLLDEIVKHYPIFYIEISKQFLKGIEKNRGGLNTGSRKLVSEIMALKSRLILNTFIQQSYSEKEIILSLLSNILQKFDSKEIVFYTLLEEVKQKMPKKYYTPIDLFLFKFYQRIGKKVLNQVFEDINHFTSHNEEYLWSFWANKKWVQWSKKTGLSKQQLIHQLKFPFDKKMFSQRLDLFVECLKTQNITNAYKTLKPKGKPIPLSIPSIGASIKNKVFYIIQYGNLPWWSNEYTDKKFNHDFKIILKSKHNREDLLLFLKSKPIQYAFLARLKDDVLFELWQKIVKSANTKSVIFISELIRFFETHFEPLQFISKSEISALKLEISKLLLKKDSREIKKVISDYFQKWLKTAEISKSKSAQQFLKKEFTNAFTNKVYSSFQKNLLKILNFSNLASVESNGSSHFSDFSLSDFLKLSEIDSSRDNQSQTTILMIQLIKINQSSSKTLGFWLSEEKFRSTLLNNLQETDLIKFIKTRLNDVQKEFFNNSLTLLKEYCSLLSLQEATIIKQLHYKLILLNLGTRGFENWNIKNWNHLLLTSFKYHLGEKKSLKILVALKNETKIVSKTSLKILDELFENLIVKTKEKKPLEKKKNEHYKKLGEKNPKEFIDPIFIKNAGLIITAPYLGMLFEKCELLVNNQFVNEDNLFRAIHLLDYLVTGENGKDESQLVLNKVLCGMSIYDPIEKDIELTSKEKELADSLLTAITQQWKPLEKTSIDGLRTSFLQREGKIEENEGFYYLKVEQKSFDMLLDQIPWTISKVKLTWMKKMIQTEWR